MRPYLLAAALFALAACSDRAPHSDAPAPPPVTYGMFGRITPGMSYDQVVEITGRRGEQKAANEVDGRLVRSYVFGDGSDSFIVMFDEDRVIQTYPGTLQTAPPL